ncbi:hypothetical protein POM88_026329 [Heracleum sosnowskyi]|uniref:Uncharacterized protein n=1 Tax=Heracleum sosnowskyi TaxID=360622 RepID=A0AAD8I8X0_9APIA|nr:hypothetical protein POM88_026329 [Heracleum sosnowskyi]
MEKNNSETGCQEAGLIGVGGSQNGVGINHPGAAAAGYVAGVGGVVDGGCGGGAVVGAAGGVVAGGIGGSAAAVGNHHPTQATQVESQSVCEEDEALDLIELSDEREAFLIEDEALRVQNQRYKEILSMLRAPDQQFKETLSMLRAEVNTLRLENLRSKEELEQLEKFAVARGITWPGSRN